MKHTSWISAIKFLPVSTILVAAAFASPDDNSVAKIQVSDCGSLQGLAIPASAIGLPTSGAVIQTAALVAETAKGNINGEFCKVTGIIKPVNPKSPNIEFEVNLPTA